MPCYVLAANRNAVSLFLKVVYNMSANCRLHGKQFQMMGPWTGKLQLQ